MTTEPVIIKIPTMRKDGNGKVQRMSWPWKTMKRGDIYHIVSGNSQVRRAVSTSAGAHKRYDDLDFKLRCKTIHAVDGQDPYVMVRAIDITEETPDMTQAFNDEIDRKRWDNAEASDPNYADGITATGKVEADAAE